MKRTVEVWFSDDAVRRGEIDQNEPRLSDLYALVRKLFGLGRIPLTLTCTIEGVPFVSSIARARCRDETHKQQEMVSFGLGIQERDQDGPGPAVCS